MRFFVSLLSVLLIASAAEACKCRPPPSAKDAAAESVAVLSGKITKVEAVGELHKKVTVEVTASYKGAAKKEVVIQTANDSAACGYQFEKGKSYLIYANESGEGKEKTLTTNTCTRTRAIADAADDIKELGEGTKPK